MNLNIFEIFGYLASANACLMMIPQLYLSIKKKSFNDLSINMICMNLLTQALFFPYSIHFKLYPLIVVNSMLSSCDIIILYCFFSHRKNNDDELVKNLLDGIFKDSSSV
jgi:uncharacterized protein with PQ loop repeat